MVVPGFDLLGEPTMILNSTAWRKAGVGEGGANGRIEVEFGSRP